VSGESRESHGASSLKSPEDLVTEQIKTEKSFSCLGKGPKPSSKDAPNTTSEHLVDSNLNNSSRDAKASPDQESGVGTRRKRRTLLGVSETLRQKIRSEKDVSESTQDADLNQNQAAFAKKAEDVHPKKRHVALKNSMSHPDPERRDKGHQCSPLNLKSADSMVTGGKAKKEAVEEVGGKTPPAVLGKKDHPAGNEEAQGKPAPRSSRRQAAVAASRKVRKTLLSLESHSDEEEEESGCEGLTLNPVVQPLSKQIAQAT